MFWHTESWQCIRNNFFHIYSLSEQFPLSFNSCLVVATSSDVVIFYLACLAFSDLILILIFGLLSALTSVHLCLCSALCLDDAETAADVKVRLFLPIGLAVVSNLRSDN